MAWFRNHYVCQCGNEWDDDWSAMCDDECASCGQDISPDRSEELPSEVCTPCHGIGFTDGNAANECRACEGHGCNPT